jgi:hypothetical protein
LVSQGKEGDTVSPRARQVPTETDFQRRFRESFQALARQEHQGPLTERGEFVMDETTMTAVKVLEEYLGGRGARGKAIRIMLQKSAQVLLAEWGMEA